MNGVSPRVIKNFNTVTIEKNVVIKEFAHVQRFQRELQFHKIFKEYVRVPEIYTAHDNKIVYERIRAPRLRDVLKEKKDVSLLIDSFSKIPLLHGEMQPTKLFQDIVTKYPIDFEPTLVHGDFRTANILYDGEPIFIDFEAGNYLFPEFDLAYLEFNIHSFGMRDVVYQFEDYVRQNYDYRKYAVASLFVTEAALKNPRNDQDALLRRKHSIEQFL